MAASVLEAMSMRVPVFARNIAGFPSHTRLSLCALSETERQTDRDRGRERQSQRERQIDREAAYLPSFCLLFCVILLREQLPYVYAG